MNNKKNILSGLMTFIVLNLTFHSGISLSNIDSESEITRHFSGEVADAKLTIDYADLSRLLSVTVFDVGRSFRMKANRNRPKIGTRLTTPRKLHTALEANRFDFESFKASDENKLVLDEIRNSLVALPDELPLNQFSLNEQLAYWLNLYNVTLIRELVENASNSIIADQLYGEESFLDKKLLVVDKVKLSLNDIQFKIIYPKFKNNPLVIYGFYQGNIGGPNIRPEAYEGRRVFQQLTDNAEEFINSNRGVRMENNGELGISYWYQRNSDFFPDFEVDITQHLAKYLDVNYLGNLDAANGINPTISDMHLANMTSGERQFGGSISTSASALLDSGLNEELIRAELGNMSAETYKLLLRLKTNRAIRKGFIEIKSDNEEEKNKPVDE